MAAPGKRLTAAARCGSGEERTKDWRAVSGSECPRCWRKSSLNSLLRCWAVVVAVVVLLWWAWERTFGSGQSLSCSWSTLAILLCGSGPDGFVGLS